MIDFSSEACAAPAHWVRLWPHKQKVLSSNFFYFVFCTHTSCHITGFGHTKTQHVTLQLYIVCMQCSNSNRYHFSRHFLWSRNCTGALQLMIFCGHVEWQKLSSWGWLIFAFNQKLLPNLVLANKSHRQPN